MRIQYWKKALGISLLCLGIFVGIGCIPRMLSSGSGRQILFSLIHRETGLTCEAEDIRLSWWGSQYAGKIHILGSNQQQEVFFADKLQIEGSLLRLLLYRKPKSVSLQGWSLKINENLSIDSPSISHLDPGSFLHYLGNSSFISEHGSIVMKTIDGTDLSVSGFYVKKTPNTFIVKASAQEGDTTGSVFIESSFSPTTHIQVEIQSVPITFCRLFIPSPTWDRVLAKEKALNVTATANYEDGKILTTAYIKGSEILAKLQGYIYKSTLHIIENSASFIELQPQIATSLFSEVFPLPHPVTSQHIQAYISEAKIPLNMSKWDTIEISLQAVLSRLLFLPSDPNLSVQMDNVDVGIRKTERYTHVRSSALAILGGASHSYINGTLSVDHKKKVSDFKIQQSLLPHTYLRAFFPKPFDINLPLEVPYYSLDIKGKSKHSQIYADVSLDNPLLKLTCSISGANQAFLFQGNGTYYIPEKWKDKLSPHFSYAEANFSGKAQISSHHLFLPKISGKIVAGENEVFFHGKFGKTNEPIKPETSATLIYGKIHSFPLNIFSQRLSPLQVKKANFSFHTDGGKSSTKGSLQAIIEDPENPILPGARVSVPELLIGLVDPTKGFCQDNIKIRSAGEVSDLSIDRILKTQEKDIALSKYFGPTGDLIFSCQYSPSSTDRFIFESSFKAEALSSTIKVVMDHSWSLSPESQGMIQWDISPERYLNLFQNFSYSPSCLLHRPASIRLDITKLSCDTSPSGLSCLTFFTETGVEGKLSASSLVFYDHLSKENFIVSTLSGSVLSRNLNKELRYELVGDCLSSGQESKAASGFTVSGTVQNLLVPENRIFVQTIDWKNVPSNFVVGLFPISPLVKTKITSLAGEKIQASIKNTFFQNEGPLTIHVNSANLQAYIPLVLTKQAILLDDDLTATLDINEDINKAFLNEFNPLISSSAYSKHPVLLRVEKQDFYLPIHPYSLDDFTVSSAVLDFGKISIMNSGTMHDLFQFLNIEENKEFVEAWFTPIFFSVQKGVIHCKRFDALVDNRIRLALWGKTNFVKELVYMNLGIDPEVIKKYFRNTSLKTKNFFIIKIRGPIAAPEIDWSSAYARIALLKSYTIASPFSSLADKLFSSLGDTTPPPTTQPFPWEENNSNMPHK